MRKFMTALAFVALTAFSPALLHAEDAKPFSDNKEINLLLLLPPPPALDSVQTKAELGEILTIQVTRSKEMEARAVADATENVWRFADAVDSPKFNAAALPKVAAFFDRVVETEAAVIDPAKDVWKRPRPHLYSDLVKPVVPLSKIGLLSVRPRHGRHPDGHRARQHAAGEARRDHGAGLGISATTGWSAASTIPPTSRWAASPAP